MDMNTFYEYLQLCKGIDRFAWTYIRDIRNALWWKVQHLKKLNQTPLLPAFQHIYAEEYWNEEKERIAYDRYEAHFANQN